MQGGQMERAQKYTEKALAQIEKVRTYGKGSQILLNTLEVLLLEHSSMCKMVVGQPSVAIKEISRLCHISQRTPVIFANHESQIHALLVQLQTLEWEKGFEYPKIHITFRAHLLGCSRIFYTQVSSICRHFQ